jgi:transcriptional regulator with XRE-family HTH domain
MVGQRISALLATLRISQAEFGRRIGRAKFTVNDWIKGRGRPSIDDLATIRAVFGVDLVEKEKRESDQPAITADSDAKHDAEVIAEMSLRLPPDARRALIQLAALLEKRDRGHEDADDEQRSRTHGRTRGGRAGASR